MAEVFLAVQEGIGGFEKLVVIKRIFPQFCDDPHFVAMFLQEARLAASIRHPNVVHINDIDQDESGYFLVMEYLPGESLAYCWEALKTHKRLMPPNIVCRIGASIAAGLHHAHIATDVAGNPQPIVHRDVTPSNLIVCYNGMVKIVDFGVAKATLAEGQTRGGALKGKMSYLSPEQIKDEPIDGRTDVFQLGICLHEMLTGRRLFRGKTDHNKLQAVMEKQIVPPSQFNPRVPRILDEVVLRSLNRDKSARHKSAEHLRRELDNALGELGNVVADADVGAWMRETFSERHSERMALERECVSQVREGRLLEGSGAGSGSSLSEIPGKAPPQRTPTLATVLDRPGQSVAATAAGTGGRTALWAGLAVVVLIGAASLFAWQAGGDDAAKAANTTASDGFAEVAAQESFVHVTATPQTAQIFIDGERIGIGYGETRMVTSDRHVLLVSAIGYESFEETFVGDTFPKVVRLNKVPIADDNDSRAGGSADSGTEQPLKPPKKDRPKKDPLKKDPPKKDPAKKDPPKETLSKGDPPKKDPPKDDDFIKNTDNIDPFD